MDIFEKLMDILAIIEWSNGDYASTTATRGICSMNDAQSPLRLRKKHGSGKPTQITSADGERLAEAQSVRNACVMGLIIIVVFSMFWVAMSELTDRVFPWFTVVLGLVLGHGIRLAGRGIDWRFPLIAAVFAIAGSFYANIVVAASVTAEGFGTGTLEILQAVTSMTWPVFIDERMTFADAFFAVVGAGFAAYYANRRLTRSQFQALRLWQEKQQDD